MAKLANLTKEELIKLYNSEKKSLDDIASLYGVSRPAVYKHLKKLGLITRSKSQARLEAQKQDKLPQKFFEINENFFSSWNKEMAYVSGLIITDGCISKTGAVSLNINDRELLEKVKEAMSSEHNITPSKHQKGLYCFHFAREKLVEDLYKLGIFPRKSLTVKFPEIPEQYLPDFIRGIFDGDGSVYFEKRTTKFTLRSNFVSGSEYFIEGLQRSLEHYFSMPRRTIYKQKTKNGWSYKFVYGHKDSVKLFDVLYKNVQNRLFLERKYRRFLEGLNISAGGS